VQAAAEIAGVQWLALDQPLPDTLAPLLRSQVIPALRARNATA
jgi:hypothetical protein